MITDFDGTLSPIVRDPMGARIEPGARAGLRRLARISAARPERLRIAILSGRAARDVAARVRVGGIRYLGNHGLEEGFLRRGDAAERLRVRAAPGVATDGGRALRLGAELHARLGRPPWLFVEDKGPSVAFHYRQAPDPAAARAALLAALADLGVAGAAGPWPGDPGADASPAHDAGVAPGHGLERIEGRQVVELRPLGVGGKGAATERVIGAERPAAILALGDDVSDADAFRAVARARTAGDVSALVVAVHGAAETPAEVVAAADRIVASPAVAARVLGELARALGPGPTRPAPAKR